MMPGFDECDKFVRRWEGGLSDLPHDPGGLTMEGISQVKHPEIDVVGMSVDERRAFRMTEYWDKMQCGRIQYPMSLILYDTAIHCGRSRASRWLQEELNFNVAVPVKVDGVIGKETLTELLVTAPGRLIYRYLSRRMLHYSSLRKSPAHTDYVVGWFGRVGDLLRVVGST